jgi:hypothetical protein
VRKASFQGNPTNQQQKDHECVTRATRRSMRKRLFEKDTNDANPATTSHTNQQKSLTSYFQSSSDVIVVHVSSSDESMLAAPPPKRRKRGNKLVPGCGSFHSTVDIPLGSFSSNLPNKSMDSFPLSNLYFHMALLELKPTCTVCVPGQCMI